MSTTGKAVIVGLLILLSTAAVSAQTATSVLAVLRGYLATPTTASNPNGDSQVNTLDFAYLINKATQPTSTNTPTPSKTSTPTPSRTPSPTPGSPSGTQPVYPPDGITSWKLDFEDNFNGSSLDTAKWNLCHAYTDGFQECVPDWYEPNYMATTPESVTVGPTTDPVTGQTLNVVKLWALNKTPVVNGQTIANHFTAGAITTVGKNNVYSFKTGYMEAKARLPVASGLDPAIWTMALEDHQNETWPLGGEMDLIEQKGNQVTYDVAVICGGTPHQGKWDLSSVYAANKPPLNKPVDGGFHIYSMYWTNSFVKIYLDGNLVLQSGSVCSSYVPTYKAHYILLTMLMGTSGSGYPDTSKSTFGVMEVDYVRVWKP